MICLGILFDTELMTISVPEEKVVNLKEELSTWLSLLSFNKRQLQFLLGKLSYVTACVQPGRIFTNRLLNVLRSFTSRKQRLPVTKEMRNDILWWLHVLDLYNGVSIIPELYWREDTLEQLMLVLRVVEVWYLEKTSMSNSLTSFCLRIYPEFQHSNY